MRAVALSMLLVALVFSVSSSGTIGLYNDSAGTSCNIIVTDGPVLKTVYVVHISSSGVTGSEWAAPKPACWPNAMYMNDTEQFSMPGNSQTGKSMGYGTCKTGVIYILAINYFVQGTSPACCLYPVLPAPFNLHGEVEAMDCDFNLVTEIGLVSTINADGTCPCGYPVAVEETTWGAVKALFDE